MCMYVYGRVRAQSGLVSRRVLSHILLPCGKARVFGCYGGGLSMLRSEKLIKDTPCSFVAPVRFLREDVSWTEGLKGRPLQRRRRRLAGKEKERKKERESLVTPHGHTYDVPFA
jgi:hypothetical protein